jgi:CDP-glucose 4,6-dehydratase
VGERARSMENVAVNRAFWRDKRVFLTGHTGFKGGWLALWLHSLGARVFGYSLAPATSPSFFEAAQVGVAIGHRVGDIRDLSALRAALREARPDVVMHLAAQSLVRQSYADPVETYSTNVMGTVNVLEAVRGETSVQAVLVITSDKCYENREQHAGYRESDPMGGRDPYSSSKGCAELVTAAYRLSFFEPSTPRHTRIASARAGNVIGGGDWSTDRLIPDVYRAAKSKQPVLIRNPKAVRPWQHVLEPLSGYLLLAEKMYKEGSAFSGGWNFGPEDRDAMPVSEVLDRLVRKWGEGLRWEVHAGSHPHEAILLRLDSTKARTELGWQPRLALDQALDWSVEWYKASLRGDHMQTFTCSQIEEYMKLEAG